MRTPSLKNTKRPLPSLLELPPKLLAAKKIDFLVSFYDFRLLTFVNDILGGRNESSYRKIKTQLVCFSKRKASLTIPKKFCSFSFFLRGLRALRNIDMVKKAKTNTLIGTLHNRLAVF